MKLTSAQHRLLLNLQKRKERERLGLCIVEGEKFVKDVKKFVEFSFTDKDTSIFREVVSTETPQRSAAVAKVPQWTREDIDSRRTILVLDGVQDPGNVGTILRLALGFDASVILVESAEVTNPKTVRSSVGALFYVPWMAVEREGVEEFVASFRRPAYRLELRKEALEPREIANEPMVLVVGSEGRGIKLEVEGQSVAIKHHPALESLNVAVAVGMVLYERLTRRG